MPVRKVGSRWLVDIRYRGKRVRVRSPGTTKADAQAHETYLRGELAKHGSLAHLEAAPTSVPTFAEFAARWMREHVAANNKPSEQRTKHVILRVHLMRTFGSRRLDEIDASTVAAFVARQRARGLAAKTVNNQLAVLRRLLRDAERWGVVQAAPRIEPLKTKPPPFAHLSPEEVRALMEAAPHDLARTLIVVAAHTGLRKGELLGLDWADFDRDRRLLRVARAYVQGQLVTPKNGRVRHVPLGEHAFAAIDRLPRMGTAMFLFRGARVNEGTAGKWLRRTCDRAGVARVGWHALRHTFASQLAGENVSLYVIGSLLGHSSPQMTQRYAHLTDGPGRAAVARLSLPPRNGHSADTPSDALASSNVVTSSL